MKKDLEYYLNLPYEIIIKRLSESEGGGISHDIKTSPILWAMDRTDK